MSTFYHDKGHEQFSLVWDIAYEQYYDKCF